MKKLAALAVVAAMIVPAAAFAVTGTIQATADVPGSVTTATPITGLRPASPSHAHSDQRQRPGAHRPG